MNHKKSDPGPTIGLPEANKLLGIPKSTGYMLVERGKYPAKVFQVGGRYRVVAADVATLLTPSLQAE